jgi:hypothetical protein
LPGRVPGATRGTGPPGTLNGVVAVSVEAHRPAFGQRFGARCVPPARPASVTSGQPGHRRGQ